MGGPGMAERFPTRVKKPKIVGAIEPVTVKGKTGSVRVLARIDTGASRTTIDLDLAAKVGLGPVLDTVRVRAAISEHAETRPLVDADIRIRGEEFRIPVGLTDRADMRYHVIIGMDVLRKGQFLIDPAKEARKTNAAPRRRSNRARAGNL